MAKDFFGQSLRVGDIVVVPATVTAVFDSGDPKKANITILTEHQQAPPEQGQLVWTLHSVLLEKDTE
jgi:hypothetical protein